MKHINLLLATLILSLLFPPDVHSQWVTIQQNDGTTLQDVFFTGPNTGFAVGGNNEDGHGVMLASTDGGDTWKNVVLGIDHELGSVFFPSKNIGYTNGLKTTDGGSTWVPMPSPGNYFETDFFFINDTLGFYLDINGYYGKTLDGGASWSYLSGPLPPSVKEKILFTTDSMGFMVGWYSGTINKTTDQGATWSLVDNMQATSISFPSVDTGYVVGWYGVIQKTTDGGESWFLQNTGILTDYRFNDIVCTDNNTCYAVGQHGIIVKTDNGGLIWEYQNAGTTEDLHEVHFTNQHTGFAVGAKGTILKTNNGGGLSSTTATKQQPVAVTIHPNPVDDILYIKCPACENADLQLVVYNALGAVLISRTLQSENAQVDVTAFVGGIYYYALFTKEGLADRGRFVKQ